MEWTACEQQRAAPRQTSSGSTASDSQRRLRRCEPIAISGEKLELRLRELKRERDSSSSANRVAGSCWPLELDDATTSGQQQIVAMEQEAEHDGFSDEFDDDEEEEEEEDEQQQQHEDDEESQASDASFSADEQWASELEVGEHERRQVVANNCSAYHLIGAGKTAANSAAQRHAEQVEAQDRLRRAISISQQHAVSSDIAPASKLHQLYNNPIKIQMRTIFSCMWPSCTRNCDSLDDIERHVRSHLGPKQFDAIGDEDFYYEETEVDEATYLAIFGRPQSMVGGKQGAQVAGAEQQQLNMAKCSSGPLSPGHNSDGLSSGQSFASSSPATSPVCSTDSSHSSPGGPSSTAPNCAQVGERAQTADAAGARAAMLVSQQHAIVFSQPQLSGHEHERANAKANFQPLTGLGALDAGHYHRHHLNHLNHLDDHLEHQHQPGHAYWLTAANFHGANLFEQQVYQQHHHIESFGRSRGLASGAFYAGAAAKQRGGRRKRHRSARQQQQQQAHDEQPLQFSLELGGSTSPRPGSLQRQRATYGRAGATATANTHQGLARATPRALADHTYNSPPPERPAELDLSSVGAATQPKQPQQRSEAMQVVQTAKTRGRRGRLRLDCDAAQQSFDEHDDAAPNQNHNHLTKPKSQQPQPQPQPQHRRNSHLKHEIFHYPMPGDQRTNSQHRRRIEQQQDDDEDTQQAVRLKTHAMDAFCDEGGGTRQSRANENRKCRKVYGMERRDLWCTQCKWKKACSRFCDQ